MAGPLQSCIRRNYDLVCNKLYLGIFSNSLSSTRSKCKKKVLRPTQVNINVETYDRAMNVVTINDNMCRVFELALYVLIMPPSARDTISTMN